MPYSESEILLLDHSCILEADTFFLGLGSAPTSTSRDTLGRITFVLHIYCLSNVSKSTKRALQDLQF